MSDSEMYQKGLSIRQELFGADVVERRMAAAGEFSKFWFWTILSLPKAREHFLNFSGITQKGLPHEL